VLDYSRLDEDRLGSAETNSAFAAIQNGNLKHTEDAMIGATALIEADIFVTNDEKFRRKFIMLKSNVKIMSFAEFSSYLSSLSTEQPQ
jgi:predicted nucleic acid-binding protein